METSFFKSLDREFEIFGLRGRWVMIFLSIAGAGLLFGIIVGCVAGSAVGIVTVILAVVVDFFFCVTTQTRVPGRQVARASLSGKVSGWVVRRESLSRILLEDPEYTEVMKAMKSKER